MTDWSFHPTLVAPFYLHFMGGNILTITSTAERVAVLDKFRERARELDDGQLSEMLASTWRPSLMAAWYIAHLKRVRFVPVIEQMLITRPAHVLHLCVCLAHLQDDSAPNALLFYLEACAQGRLQANAGDESITPEWALCALEYLDSGITATQGRSLWNAFLDWQKQSQMRKPYLGKPAEEHRLQPYLKHWDNRLTRSRQIFPRLMDMFTNELGEA